MLHQIKAPQFYADLGIKKTVLNPLANGKIQGLFKAFECFSSTFQGKFHFQSFQDSTVYSNTFQACANPDPACITFSKILYPLLKKAKKMSCFLKHLNIF